jgi:hypothetical protein
MARLLPIRFKVVKVHFIVSFRDLTIVCPSALIFVMFVMMDDDHGLKSSIKS